MRTIASLSLAALVAACSAPKDAKPAADTAMAAAPAPAGPPRAVISVVYSWPKDTAAFEKYYPGHLKLVEQHQKEVGFTSAKLTRFTEGVTGGKPEYYRQAQLFFPTMDALKAAMATPGFKAIGGDLANFVAPGGALLMIGEETTPPNDAPCAVVATMFYGTPTDAAAFEAGYARHLDLVRTALADIGYTSAEGTRFVSNLDGKPPALQRQAELCFADMAALTKGIGSQAFSRVFNDIPNFSTGGQRGMIGVHP